MRKSFLQYQDMIARMYPEEVGHNSDSSKRILTRTVTFQVTDSCNLACTYCYQINKGVRKMSFETAKKFIDLVLSGEKGFGEYLDADTSPAIIFEFIGGEPFLEVELITKICDYITERLIELDHKWLYRHMFSICSNGTLYRTEGVQRFLSKYQNKLSFSITIDGNKELHDSCRVFHDGKPSYDIAIDGALDWVRQGHYMGSKITIAPSNLTYVYDAILHMINLGYTEINANTVYEKGWTIEHAKEFYCQLKNITNYLLENKLYDDVFISLFVDSFFKPKSEEDNQNWCGGTGFMLACDPDGKLFPCIRYMESSVGTCVKPYSIGNINDGIGTTNEEQCRLSCLNCVSRRSESSDECFYCPIAEGCSWCSAYNYQENGTPDKRVTYSCDMHKVRALSNAYYWCRVYELSGTKNEYHYYLPDSEALKYISEEELNMIKSHPLLVDHSEEYKDYFTK